ncbi:MAG: mRNA interferase RelE/StbE [Candidatus Latescibacterota bacterium]
MAKYRVLIKPSAAREIEVISQKKQRQRIVAKIRALEDDPRPQGCEKLTGLDRYRVRQGMYRILYAIEDNDLIVFVIKVGHRGSVYR